MRFVVRVIFPGTMPQSACCSQILGRARAVLTCFSAGAERVHTAALGPGARSRRDRLECDIRTISSLVFCFEVNARVGGSTSNGTLVGKTDVRRAKIWNSSFI